MYLPDNTRLHNLSYRCLCTLGQSLIRYVIYKCFLFCTLLIVFWITVFGCVCMCVRAMFMYLGDRRQHRVCSSVALHMLSGGDRVSSEPRAHRLSSSRGSRLKLTVLTVFVGADGEPWFSCLCQALSCLSRSPSHHGPFSPSLILFSFSFFFLWLLPPHYQTRL